MTEPANSSREGDPIDGSQANTRRAGSASVDVQRFATRKNVVRVNGGLIGGAASTLHQTLCEELKRSPAQLVLDLRGVTGIDSAGVDVLVSAAALAALSAISFAFVATEMGPVGAALAPADVRQLVEIFASVQDAWEHKG
jgi:anti-sigma B factor antagonist